MEMQPFENLTTNQKYHICIHKDVRKISTEVTHNLGLEIKKEALELIAELIYKKLKCYGSDLEVFAKHAKRNTINNEDIKVLVRRNSALKNLIDFISIQKDVKSKKRKIQAPINKALVTTKMSKKKDDVNECINKDLTAMDNTIDLTFD